MAFSSFDLKTQHTIPLYYTSLNSTRQNAFSLMGAHAIFAQTDSRVDCKSDKFMAQVTDRVGAGVEWMMGGDACVAHRAPMLLKMGDR